MGGGHYPAAHFAAEFDDRHSQGCALRRIGAGAQLIKQYECSVIALVHYIHNGSHMAGESGKTLSNRLLIANIRQDRIEGGKPAAVTGRNMQTALSHQCQQADRFQSHSLAAGVGAGDDHGIKISTQPQCSRYYLFRIDQRMTGISQLHSALIIHFRCPGVHTIAQFRLCEDHIQVHEHIEAQLNIATVTGGLSR